MSNRYHSRMPRGAHGARTVGGFLVPGSNVANVNQQKMLDDVYETNVISASNRLIADWRKKTGETLSPSVARTAVVERYNQGEHDLLPQFRAVQARLNGESK